jgi:hypothetical protein
MKRHAGAVAAAYVFVGVGAACPAPIDVSLEPGWQLVAREVPGALLSVSERDGVAFVVGGDPDGPDGPASATLMLWRHEGPAVPATPVTIDTGLQGDLWWVHATSATRAYASGSAGRVVRLDVNADGDDVTVTPLLTPAGLDSHDHDLIVFGVFAADDDAEIYAVGGRNGGLSGGFVWRSVDGGAFAPLPIDADGDGVIDDAADEESVGYALWKVDAIAGPSPLRAVWIVGTNGLAFRADGGVLVAQPTGFNTSLFTVDVDDDGAALAVGGLGRGLVVENAGGADDPWVDVSPAGDLTPSLLGVHRVAGAGLLVGNAGAIFAVDADGTLSPQSVPGVSEGLHGAAALVDGSRYAVGGRLTGLPLVGGVIARFVPGGRE